MRASLLISFAFVVGCSSVDVPGASVANPLDAQESKVVVDLNMFRADNGLGALAECTILNVTASAHADDMRDQMYLNDTSPDGTLPRARACAAGFTTACDTTSSFAELVASGDATGDGASTQWEMDSVTMPILLNGNFTVMGVGRSIGGDKPLWALDVSSGADPACN